MGPDKNAGTYKVTVTGKGKYAGYKETLTYKIAAKTQTVKITSKDRYSLKASVLKKKSKSYSIKLSKKTGTVSYTSNNSKIKVSNSGRITIAKGTKKGIYQVKVTVKAKNHKTVNKYIQIVVK